MRPIWIMYLIVAGRGGIGKTLLAVLLATLLLRLNRPPLLLQADIQRRLDALYPDLTSTISIDKLDELANDPLALVRAFSAIPARMRECAAAARDLIVDTAATWHSPIIRYAAEIRLAEKTAALKGQLTFMVPTTADVDSMALAIETLRMIERLVPTSRTFVIMNCYPEPPDFEVPALQKHFGRNEVQRLLKRHAQIKLPPISPKIWGQFERANLTPLDVIAAEPAELTEVAGDNVDTVEVMQGRVAAWLNLFSVEAKSLLLAPHG